MSKLRILHLEDDPHFAAMVQSMLDTNGLHHEIKVVDTRKDFEAAIKDGPFDLILSDFSLPGFDGLEALKICRRACPMIPFVFLSGTMGEELAVDSLKAGAANYVLKSNLSRLIPTVFRTVETARETVALRKAQERIRNDQFNLRALIENTSDAIFSLDTDFKVLVFNSSASLLSLKLCGRPLQFGVNFLEVLFPEEKARWQAAMLKIRGRERFFEERELAWLDRSSTFEIYHSPILNDQEVTGMAVFSRDVTELKAAKKIAIQEKEIAERANRAKGRFLANMSHEIRTPLNGLMVMSNLLADSRLDSTQSHQLQIMRKSAHSLLAIINDILDFAKVEQGQLRLENCAFSLHETVADVMALMETRVEEKQLALTWSFAPQMPRNFEGDAGRLRQILLNLIGNAVKFTERGWVELRVQSRPESEGILLHFEVEDSGIGIAPESAGRLFESFSQIDTSDTRRHGGAGLGLAISKQLTALMGGDIGFTPGKAGGSIFWFTVRMRVSESAPVKDEKTATPVHAPGLPTLRILVAEDNAINQLVIIALLEKLGQKAEMAENGREVVQACHDKDYDLVFMDCQMPELDGYAATGEIRGLQKKSGRHRSWIVAMTADAMKGTRERCLEAGMDGYITKPILIEAVTEALACAARGPGEVLRPVSPPAAEVEANDGWMDSRIVARLRALCGDKPGERFGDLAVEFLAQAREKTAELGVMTQQRSFDALSKAAHGLKGVSLNFGAVAMARECDALQRLGPSDPQGELGRIHRRLEEALWRTEEALGTAASASPQRRPVAPNATDNSSSPV